MFKDKQETAVETTKEQQQRGLGLRLSEAGVGDTQGAREETPER